jgi:molecular chaperone GrpE
MMPSAAHSHAAAKNDAMDEEKKKDDDFASLHDKYLRLMAEFENYRRRCENNNERIVKTANEELMKDIIEVSENYERAFKTNDRGKNFFEGMLLNFERLTSILQKHGLEAFGEIGDEFNPELHEAVMSVSHESIADSHIIDVLERGYRLNEKIIKYAKAVVSSGKSEEKGRKSQTEINDNKGKQRQRIMRSKP